MLVIFLLKLIEVGWRTYVIKYLNISEAIDTINPSNIITVLGMKGLKNRLDVLKWPQIETATNMSDDIVYEYIV